jgi:peptidoglycan hydrolase-like protein with peptidoglycan-binding domain
MAATWPVLKEGDRDSEESNGVLKVQLLLRQRGFSLNADQIFGPITAGRVRDFQKSKNLAVDGIVGSQTWPALIVQVKKGSSGDAVRAVQSQFRSLSRDGVFGPKTDERVRQFQDDSGLAVDGIVGPNTWRTLGNGPIVD